MRCRTLCLTVLGFLYGVSLVQAADIRRIDIPAQALSSALREFVEQTGLQLAVQTSLTTGKMSPAVKGEISADKVLDQLLAGTGLTYEFLDSKTVAVSRKGQTTVKESTGLAPSQIRIAQTPASPSPALGDGERVADEDSSGVQEIVVTATKRSERLIDTPQSVTVLSAADLAKLGATQFRDFANTVPGLNFTTAGAGNSQISLRGVTTGFDVSPTTATYVDEVPYGSSTAFANGAQLGFDPALFGLDRIEVLRGPQGTLYGASSMGGLIKYVSKQPDAANYGIEAQAGVSSTHEGGMSYNGSATLNAPIVADKVALRASGFESHDGGYIDNLANGREDVNRSDVYGGRLDLLLTPTDTLKIRITAFLQNIARDGDGTADYTSSGAEPFGSLGQNRPTDETFDQRFRVISGAVTYDAGPASLTSISSYQTARSEFVWDLSAIYVPFLNAPPPGGFGRSYSAAGVPVESKTDKFTQEVRLASAANQSLEWLVGGFYTRESSSLFEAFALRDVAGQPAPNDLFTFFVPSRYEEYAAFGDLTWHFTDKFDATGGVRYARNRQEFSQTGSGAFGLNAPTNRASDDVLTYLANVRYHFNNHATGYLRYATGYRPGGPAYITLDPGTGLPNGPTTFEADRLKSYEAGFKAETAERRFGVDLAAYYIDWSNMQVSFNNNGFSSVHNAPGAGIRGAELAFSARTSRALTLTSAFAYQDAKVSETDTALRAVEDERLPNVPRFTAALSADYELPMAGSLQPTVGATLRHMGDRTSGFGAGAARLPDYTTFDLRASITAGSINTQLYVHNLFDEHGQLSIAYPQYGGRVAILQPRTIGLAIFTTF